MMFLKGCPKCSGDMLLNRDIHGQYVACLQCGYLRDVKDERESLAADARGGVARDLGAA